MKMEHTLIDVENSQENMSNCGNGNKNNKIAHTSKRVRLDLLWLSCCCCVIIVSVPVVGVVVDVDDVIVAGAVCGINICLCVSQSFGYRYMYHVLHGYVCPSVNLPAFPFAIHQKKRTLWFCCRPSPCVLVDYQPFSVKAKVQKYCCKFLVTAVKGIHRATLRTEHNTSREIKATTKVLFFIFSFRTTSRRWDTR